MTIITASEVLAQLQLDSSYTDVVNSLIDGSILKAFSESWNYPHIPDQYVKNYYISFDSATKEITNGNYDFITTDSKPNRFQAGMSIHIEGSAKNNGFYLIDSVTSNVLTVAPAETLVDEDAGANVKISLMEIDEGFKTSIIDFIGVRLQKSKGVKSERFDDYSISYSSESEAARSIFKTYRRLKFT